MINLDSITNENNKKLNEKWPYILDHPYKILITGGSGWGKTNTFLNLINKQNDIDKIYLYARDLNKSKYKILIKKRKGAYIKYVGGGPGGFYKFFKKCFVAQETIDLNISWPSNFFRKYFMAPPINFLI